MVSGCSTGGSNCLTDPALAVVVCNHFGDLDLQTQLIAFAIAIAESDGCADAWNQCGEDSRGLWQINVEPGANTQFATWNLFDPDQNGQAARILHDATGGFGPWSTYNSGAYTVYLTRANNVLAGGCNYQTAPTDTCPAGMVASTTTAGACVCADPSQVYSDTQGACVYPVSPPASPPGMVTNPQTGSPMPAPVASPPPVSGEITVSGSGSISTGALLLLAAGAGVLVYGISQQQRR